MKLLSLLSVVILLFTTISCNKQSKAAEKAPAENFQKTYAQLEKANWLIGSWGHTSPQGTLAENWKRVNDSAFKGEGFFIVNNDTVFAEYIDLIETKGKLTFTVSVPAQNNEKPVPFGMTSISENNIVFENPKHDYPAKITYNKITNDSLVAVISGVQKGKPANETFAMKRLK